MTHWHFRDDAYLHDATAQVVALTPEGGIILDSCIFYPTGGGQPGDSGHLEWDNRQLQIATAVKSGQTGDIALVPAEPERLPAVGTTVRQGLDWERRYRHMRLHTGLHLLSVAIPFPVTGGQISTSRGRLDFNMPDIAPDRDVLTERLTDLVDRDLPVLESWISDDALRRQPELIKTMSVAPPMGQGGVRLIQIGEAAEQVDLQPCGGTHVRRTGEIGQIAIGKIENKGRQNRRVSLLLGD